MRDSRFYKKTGKSNCQF